VGTFRAKEQSPPNRNMLSIRRLPKEPTLITGPSDGGLSHEAQDSPNSLSDLSGRSWRRVHVCPTEIGIDAVPADASPGLIAYLRNFWRSLSWDCSLNWMARNAELLRRVTPSSLKYRWVWLRNFYGRMGGVQWRRTPGSKTFPCDSSADDCRLRRGRARRHASPTSLGQAVSWKGWAAEF
jgi:hypothetical protein